MNTRTLPLCHVTTRSKPRLVRTIAGLVTAIPLTFATAPPSAAQEKTPPAAEQPAVSDNEIARLHREFSQRLSGSSWRGHFTIDGQPNEMKEELYEVQSVTKLPSGDLWLFKVRIRYGDHDVTVPLPLTVNWAGKTPMIVVDQLTIPALGTFDARVVIAGTRYAGTWQHGEVGGHLFGKIEPAAESADKDKQPAEEEQKNEGVR